MEQSRKDRLLDLMNKDKAPALQDRLCPRIITKGPRKDQQCGKKVTDTTKEFCTACSQTVGVMSKDRSDQTPLKVDTTQQPPTPESRKEPEVKIPDSLPSGLVVDASNEKDDGVVTMPKKEEAAPIKLETPEPEVPEDDQPLPDDDDDGDDQPEPDEVPLHKYTPHQVALLQDMDRLFVKFERFGIAKYQPALSTMPVEDAHAKLREIIDRLSTSSMFHRTFRGVVRGIEYTAPIVKLDLEGLTEDVANDPEIVDIVDLVAEENHQYIKENISPHYRLLVSIGDKIMQRARINMQKKAAMTNPSTSVGTTSSQIRSST